MNYSRLLPPYSLSTVLGLSVIGASLSSWLLDQATPRQALAATIGGLIGVLLKQATSNTVVTGSNPTVQADSAAIQPAAGSTTTIK